jgi:DNA-binding MarR family transcriptional regulator
MNLKLNPLNDVINIDQDKVKEVSQLEFWKFFIKLLNLRVDTVTNKEIDFLAYFILCDGDLKKVSEESSIVLSNCYALLKRLQEKSLINKDDNSLSDRLGKFIKFVRKVNEKEDMVFEIMMPLKVAKV